MSKHPPSKSRVEKKLDRVAGWLISLVIHCVVIVAMMAINWQGSLSGQDDNTGVDNGLPVIIEDDIAGISSEQSSIKPLKSTTAKVVTPAESGSETLPEITELPDTQIPQLKELTQSQGDAPTQLAIDDKWSDFLASSGSTSGGVASFFGLEASGSRFVYVVDYSGSMAGGKLRAAKAEVLRSISQMDSGMEFLVVFYDNNYKAMPGNVLAYATDSNKLRYSSWVSSISGGGGTDPTGAMAYALSLKPDVIWLLSDGLFPDKACDVIGSSNTGSRVVIHTIAFYDNRGERQLRRIAEENRGGFRFVRPKDVDNPKRKEGLQRRRGRAIGL